MLKKIMDNPFQTKRIASLDGLRALAVLVVAWFHIWQQSWLSPTATLPVFAPLGEPVLRLEIFPRSGYLFVDFLLVLSAFCLFLPHARHMLGGPPPDGPRVFWRKRVARIVPSYWFSVAVCFGVAVFSGVYGSVSRAVQDLGMTLTFTQTFSVPTYLINGINSVLWTAAIEMQFYLIFPLLAKWFRQHPFLTWSALAFAGEAYLRTALRDVDGLSMTVNQLPGFLGLFANGMLAAYIYVWMAQNWKEKTQSRLAAGAAVAFLLMLVLMTTLVRDAGRADELKVWQAEYRMVLGSVFTAMILLAAMAGKWFSWLFGNRAMAFLAGISYNYYIWHQWLAVKLKEWRIPNYTGEALPNMTGNVAWQWGYTILAFGLAFFVAWAVTRWVERPVARRILAQRPLEKEMLTRAL